MTIQTWGKCPLCSTVHEVDEKRQIVIDGRPRYVCGSCVFAIETQVNKRRANGPDHDIRD